MADQCLDLVDILGHDQMEKRNVRSLGQNRDVRVRRRRRQRDDARQIRSLRRNAVGQQDIAGSERAVEIGLANGFAFDELQRAERPAGGVDRVAVRPAIRRADEDALRFEPRLIGQSGGPLLVRGEVERPIRRLGLDGLFYHVEDRGDLLPGERVASHELDAVLSRLRHRPPYRRGNHRPEHGLSTLAIEGRAIELIRRHSREDAQVGDGALIMEGIRVAILEIDLLRAVCLGHNRELHPGRLILSDPVHQE